MANSLILALVGSVTSLVVAAIAFFAAVRAAKIVALVQLCRNVDLAMHRRGVANPTPLELVAPTEGLRTIREPIEYEYKTSAVAVWLSVCAGERCRLRVGGVMHWVLV